MVRRRRPRGTSVWPRLGVLEQGGLPPFKAEAGTAPRAPGDLCWWRTGPRGRGNGGRGRLRAGLGATWFRAPLLLEQWDGQREGADRLGRHCSEPIGLPQGWGGRGGAALGRIHMESGTPRPAVSRGLAPCNCPVLADLSLERVERATTNRPTSIAWPQLPAVHFEQATSRWRSGGRRDDDPRMRLAPRRRAARKNFRGFQHNQSPGCPSGAAEWCQAPPGGQALLKPVPRQGPSSRAPSRMQRHRSGLVAPLTRAKLNAAPLDATGPPPPERYDPPHAAGETGATLAEHPKYSPHHRLSAEVALARALLNTFTPRFAASQCVLKPSDPRPWHPPGAMAVATHSSAKTVSRETSTVS